MIGEQQKDKFTKERIIKILFIISIIFYFLQIIVKIIFDIIPIGFSPVNIYNLFNMPLFIVSAISFTAFIFMLIKNYKIVNISQSIVSIIFLMLATVLMSIQALSMFINWKFWENFPIDYEDTFYLGYVLVAILITLFFLIICLFLRKNKLKPTWKTPLFISTIMLSLIVIFHIILSLIITIDPIIDFYYGNIRIIVCSLYIAYLLVCLAVLFGLIREIMIVLKEKSEIDKILDISEEPKTEIDEPKILPLKIVEKIDINNLNFLLPIIISALILNIINLLANPLYALLMDNRYLHKLLWSFNQIISLILFIIIFSISFNILYEKKDEKRIKKFIIFSIPLIIALAFLIIALIYLENTEYHNTSHSEPNTLMKSKLFFSSIIIHIIMLILVQIIFISLIIEKKTKQDKIINYTILTLIITITIPLLIIGTCLFLKYNNIYLTNGEKLLKTGMILFSFLNIIGIYFPLLRLIKITKQEQTREKKALEKECENKDDLRLLQEIDFNQSITLAKSLIVSGMMIFLMRYIYQLAVNISCFYVYGFLENIIYYQHFVALIACIITGLGIRELTIIAHKPKQKKLLKTSISFLFLIMILKYVFGFFVFMIVSEFYWVEESGFWRWFDKLIVISSLYTDLIPIIIALICLGIVLRQLKLENLIEINQPITPIVYIPFFAFFFIFHIIYLISLFDLLPNISLGDWSYQIPMILYSTIGLLVSLEYIIRFSVKNKRKTLTKTTN